MTDSVSGRFCECVNEYVSSGNPGRKGGVIFEDMASKLEKIGPIFSSFNPFPSLPSAATDDSKQFQCR